MYACLYRRPQSSGQLRLTVLQAAVMCLFLVIFMTLVKTANRNGCIAVAMTLHGLLLAQFMATVAQSIFIIQRLVIIFETRAMDILKAASVIAVPGKEIGLLRSTSENSLVIVKSRLKAHG